MLRLVGADMFFMHATHYHMIAACTARDELIVPLCRHMLGLPQGEVPGLWAHDTTPEAAREAGGPQPSRC